MNLDELTARARAGVLVGAFPDVPNELYHSFTNYLSATQIGAWAKSERHYAASLKPQEFDSKALETGRLLHLLVGEPDLFSRQVAIGPEVNRNTTKWKEFESENPNRICKKPSEVEEIVMIANRVHTHPSLTGMFTGALVEWSFFGICPTTGRPVKCRPDLLTRDYTRLADLKSTRDAHPDKFPKQGYELNYHVKMGHYMDVIHIVTGIRPSLGIFIAAETISPYEVVPFVSDSDQEFGIDPLEVGTTKARLIRAEITQRLVEKKLCEDEGRPFAWRGYCQGFAPYTLPRHVAKAIAESNGAIV